MAVTSADVVIVHPPPFVVAKATIASLWKSAFIRDTFVRERRVFEKFQRSVVGDLAKLCVLLWLNEQGIDAQDWDDTRTSWRSQRKSYDLQANGHMLEVRSSIAETPSLSHVLSNEHIIHPCNIRVKEVTIQVFFSSPACDTSWICGWVGQPDLETSARRQVRRIGRRLVDFYMVPFGDVAARPMNDLLQYLVT